jgi:hypothetical protein
MANFIESILGGTSSTAGILEDIDRNDGFKVIVKVEPQSLLNIGIMIVLATALSALAFFLIKKNVQ